MSKSQNDERPSSGAEQKEARGVWSTEVQYIEEVVKKTKNIWLRAHLFGTAVLLASTHASETAKAGSACCKQQVTQRALERVMLGIVLYTQVQKGNRSSGGMSL
ncbi:hypothetical protein V3C99_001633 [Haemonchus contortus]|uniref:Uncharacterized protein n=1 Tax=Haemonchus contortus TaxID=6289 RepID=A0A7I4YCS2_HAECO